MKIIEIDVIDPEPLQAAFYRLARIGGRAVALRTIAFAIPDNAEFARDHQIVPPASDGLGEEFFIVAGAVNIGSVEQGYSQFEGAGKRGERFGFVRLAVAARQPHRAITLLADVGLGEDRHVAFLRDDSERIELANLPNPFAKQELVCGCKIGAYEILRVRLQR